MRFKAELATEQLQLLFSVIGPISRVSQHAVVYMNPEHLRVSARDAVEGISCFCELKTKGGIFLQHRIESVADNAIVFEIDLFQWRSAMQSIVGGDDGNRYGRHDDDESAAAPPFDSSITIMKLAKRHGGIPCLCLDGKYAGSVEVYHAIPIRVMRSSDIQYHLPPQMELPDVQLEMANEKPLRIVVERLKAISPHVYLEGSMTGELTLRIDSDGSSIRTFFSNLMPRFEDTKAAAATNGSTNSGTCTVKVDTKKLSTCLHWQNMKSSISSALLCMMANEMLVVHVILNPPSVGFFTFYCPVHFLSTRD